MLSLLASIPSPGSGSLHLGPLQLRAYGLCIAVGVLAAVWLASRRWVARGGSPDDFSAIALWAVPAGVVGARIYHVITDWHRFRDHPIDVVKVWEGGLGIWGGVALGVAAGAWAARRRRLDILGAMDAAAPGILLAQAIGRLGNWFNQELFGGPTDQPWGLEIDRSHRPLDHLDQATFHPTFLYEIVWNLAIVGLLLWVDHRYRLRRGKLFVLYVAGYTFGRFFIERVRIDPATEVLGLRINEIVSAAVFLLAVVVLFVGPLRAASDTPGDGGGDEDGTSPSGGPDDGDDPAVEAAVAPDRDDAGDLLDEDGADAGAEAATDAATDAPVAADLPAGEGSDRA